MVIAETRFETVSLESVEELARSILVHSLNLNRGDALAA
jgi:hypothetical protein